MCANKACHRPHQPVAQELLTILLRERKQEFADLEPRGWQGLVITRRRSTRVSGLSANLAEKATPREEPAMDNIIHLGLDVPKDTIAVAIL
jgi:hypothetical protein